MGLDYEGERKLRENVATLHNNIKKWMAEVERLRARQDYWPEMVRLEREVERLRRELASREEQVINLQGYVKDRSMTLENEVERLRAELDAAVKEIEAWLVGERCKHPRS